MPDSQENQDMNEIVMQLKYLQNLYSQQYENLENNIATYTMTNTSVQRNLELLEKSKLVEGKNIMVSGEAGAYIPAKIAKVDQVLTYIGGGYLIENTVEKAIDFLKENRKRGEDILSRLIAEKLKVEKDLIDIQYRLNAVQYQSQVQQK
ncbi:MAG: prefoldin subunit alpha [Candidatus Micrarchaeaceae archaeon]